jgi:hypothetical protein
VHWGREDKIGDGQSTQQNVCDLTPDFQRWRSIFTRPVQRVSNHRMHDVNCSAQSDEDPLAKSAQVVSSFSGLES